MKKTAVDFIIKHGVHGENSWLDCMRDYANYVATETRKKCAKQATVKFVGAVAMIDKESILDVKIETP